MTRPPSFAGTLEHQLRALFGFFQALILPLVRSAVSERELVRLAGTRR